VKAIKLIQAKRRIKVKMDYQSELKKLQEGSNYWKPKVGQFKVKALSELEDADPFIRKTKNEEGKEVEEKTPQHKLKILVDGEEKFWTFGVGKTPASTYGQIVELATKHNNKLIDVEFSVVVKSDGTKKDYTIVS